LSKHQEAAEPLSRAEEEI